jgi:hypothetical protein
LDDVPERITARIGQLGGYVADLRLGGAEESGHL